MLKLKVVIADDEQDALNVLSSILTDTEMVEVVACIEDPKKVESAVIRLQPDILFLDIRMPGINGLEILENIRTYDFDLKVIYVTAYEKYIKHAIKLNVVSYLLKPIDRLELKTLVEKLYVQKSLKDKEVITDKVKLPVINGSVFLKPEEIFKLVAEGAYTHIFTTDNQCIISGYNMGKLHQRLPEGRFMRINRGTLVNTDYIFQINRKNNVCITRFNGEECELEVSNSFITEFNKSIK